VDEEKSRVTIKYHQDNWKIYSLLGGASLIFKEEIVGTAHIFRMRYLEPQIICDQTFKDVCKEAGLKGVAFQDAIKN